MPFVSLRRLFGPLALLLLALPALGEVLAVGQFTASKPDPGWSFTGTPALTAPAVDPEGDGWLRLTGPTNQAVGSAFFTRRSFNATRGMTVAFSYASWGGGKPGGDGIALFLFDAKGNMAGATTGGGLGFCKGGGAWLGLALDEYGNFSNPQDGCAGGGGPGTSPQSVVLRGPSSAGNPFIAGAPVPGGVDHPLAQKRPPQADVVMTLFPKPNAVGFTVTVDWRGTDTGPWIRLLNQADFPYPAPAAVSVGLTASTGGARNIHEVRGLRVASNIPPTLGQTFQPSVISPGGRSTLVLHLGSTGNASASLVTAFTHQLPEAVKVANPPRLGGTCSGAVYAKPGAGTIVVERGSGVRAAGCTITVDVTSATVGTWDSVVRAGALVTDQGSNLSPSTAALTVRPQTR